MTQPNPEVDELVELLEGLEYIAVMAALGVGLDDASNLTLSSIHKRAERLIEVVRSVDETTMFSPSEIADRIERQQRRKT